MSMKTGSQTLDEHLSQQVEDSLRQLRHPQLNEITCEVEGSTVFLSGQIASYYLMQIAQATVAKVSEVYTVVNHLEVVTRNVTTTGINDR